MSAPRTPSRRSKYGARKVTVSGITFDSAGEANWYQGLVGLERAHLIKGLAPHPRFPIVIDGRPLRYEGSNRQVVVEMDAAWRDGTQDCVGDYKGFDNPLSKLKRALLAHVRPDLKIIVAGPGAPKPRTKRAKVTRTKGRGV